MSNPLRRGSLLALLAVLSYQGGAAQDSTQVWVDIISAPQYFAVLVEDVDAAVAWYRNVFGLVELDDTQAEDGAWRIVNLSNEQLFVEVIRDDRARAAERVLGFRKVGFHVPDVEVIAERVEQATGERPRIVDDDRFGIRLLQIRDPEGNIIQLSSRLKDGP